MSCPKCKGPLDVNLRCRTCSALARADAGYAICRAAGCSPRKSLFGAALAAAAPAILDGAIKLLEPFARPQTPEEQKRAADFNAAFDALINSTRRKPE